MNNLIEIATLVMFIRTRIELIPTPMTPITKIQKEMLETTHFPKQEVLKDPEGIKERKDQAERAMVLGNSTNNKVRIVFEDTVGTKMVETTVWGVTDLYLLLKRGMTLPIHCIYQIII